MTELKGSIEQNKVSKKVYLLVVFAIYVLIHKMLFYLLFTFFYFRKLRMKREYSQTITLKRRKMSIL